MTVILPILVPLPLQQVLLAALKDVKQAVQKVRKPETKRSAQATSSAPERTSRRRDPAQKRS